MSPVSIHCGWDLLATGNSAQNFRVRPPVPQGTLGGGGSTPTVPGTCVLYSFGTTNPRMQCANTASSYCRAGAVRDSGDRGDSLPATGSWAMVRRRLAGTAGSRALWGSWSRLGRQADSLGSDSENPRGVGDLRRRLRLSVLRLPALGSRGPTVARTEIH